MQFEGLLAPATYGKRKPGANSPSSNHSISKGLRYCLPMGEGAGATLYDIEGKARVALTSCTWSVKPVGNAITLNGTSSFGQTQYKPGWTSSNRFSIVVWVRTTDADRGCLFGDYVSAAATNVEVFSDGKARFFISTGVGNSKDYRGGTTINDGKWHQVVCTFGGNQNPLIYVDGKLETLTKTTDNTLAAAAITSGSAYRLGRDNRAASPIWLGGDLSFVGVWDRVLSQGEVRDLYYNPFLLIRKTGLSNAGFNAFPQSGTVGLATGTWTALAPTATSTASGTVGLAAGSWTALAPTTTSTASGTVGLAVGTWTALAPTVGGVLTQSGVVGLATGGWFAYGVTAYRNDESSIPPEQPTVALDPSVVEYPFEIPRYSQNTLRKDILLGDWNFALVAWWDNVRKKLHSKLGTTTAFDLAELLRQNELLQAELERLKARSSIVKRYYGSSNTWVFEHKRGCKPIVAAWVYYQEFSSVDFEQVESSSNNITTLRFGANYSGEAVYAFPDL